MLLMQPLFIMCSFVNIKQNAYIHKYTCNLDKQTNQQTCTYVYLYYKQVLISDVYIVINHKYVLYVSLRTFIFSSFCDLNSLNSTFMSFQPTMASPPSHSDLTASPSPSLLDTHSRVWVWLPSGYWGNQTGSTHYQKSVLDIGQVRKHKGYRYS